MKMAFVLSLLLLATAVQHSEGLLFTHLREAVRKTTSEVRDSVNRGVSTLTTRVKGTVRKGVANVTTGVKDFVGKVRDAGRGGVQSLRDRLSTASTVIRNPIKTLLRNAYRGKRSALTMNRLDDVNAVDIATTLKLELPAVKGVFMHCDVDNSGSLDGQEVLTFLRMIENLAVESAGKLFPAL